MATTPPNESILASNREGGDNVVENSAALRSETTPFNIPPFVPPITFTTNSSASFNGHPLTLSSSANLQPGSGPRRGSFPDILPHGHTIPSAINQGGHLSGDTATSIEGVGLPVYKLGQDELQTDSDPDFRYSRNPSRMSLPPRSVNPPEGNDNSTITITTPPEGPANDLDAASATTLATTISTSQRNKSYVLSDGSVVNGKGLGRGRPGVKRGPRNPKYQSVEDGSSQVSTRSVGDIVKPPNKKRKSGDSDIIKARSSTSHSATGDSRESSEEYNPTGQTRSGRQIQKLTPLANVTPTPVGASPGKFTRADSTTHASATPSSTVKSHPKIKRRVYRGREQFALCEHCLRGHGPPGNVIVFCDACNKCWHQRCHEPQISKETVSNSKADWFCSECDRILHGGKKAKKSHTKPAPQEAPIPKANITAAPVYASDLAPDLPLFETLVPPPPPPATIPQAKFTSTYVTPVTHPPTLLDRDAGDAIDEGYDGYYDEHAALYPKPGQGVRLPPEREDLRILLEGKESRTFSHWVRGMPGNEYSGTGNITAGHN
ncbi:hypothetical protein LTR44_010810 [Exophiala sp. CCFEE 6388]|uniref:PHD-type domain-containing protein n=1 Tax=Exophiala sideris TaxID=1016849 RepID=A0ABR0IW51_9EURO|nr:hypothetical protein LTR69_010943 [Exophiala sideris]KAK5176628.1 hypothetical protein LTR44_010810 [Eurotiomycetes sp. CCFEE 6388]